MSDFKLLSQLSCRLVCFNGRQIILGLFQNVFKSSVYIATKGLVNNESWYGRKSSMANLKFCLGICKKELRKHTKYLFKIQPSRPAIEKETRWRRSNSDSDTNANRVLFGVV